MTDSERDGQRGQTGHADLDAQQQRRAVRTRYAGIAREGTREQESDDGCCSTGSTCGDDPDETAAQLGYSTDDVESVADGANLGLGCGNPQAIANLDAGETVLDLGSGAGFDCFLAADAVGPSGRVVGVDMTPEMVEKARENARRQDTEHVEFRLGEIEHLPVADRSVDVVISNCVVNLSADKPQVFREAARVLRPGGRIAISDVVRTAPVPEARRADPDSLAACTAGAASISELEGMLTDAGFEAVAIEPVDGSDEFIREWDPDRDPSEYLTSARITGRLPSD
jgi:SAM-dependent methyltransferase